MEIVDAFSVLALLIGTGRSLENTNEKNFPNTIFALLLEKKIFEMIFICVDHLSYGMYLIVQIKFSKSMVHFYLILMLAIKYCRR